MTGRDILPGRKPTDTELKLAEAIGMKTKGIFGDVYLHWEAILDETKINMTRFTQPPHFSTDKRWIPILKQIAREKFKIILEKDNNPEEVARELLDKLKE